MRQKTRGWLNGLIGVLIFSGSLPATRVAVTGFDPVFLTGARGAIAGVLAACLLLIGRQTRPTRQDLPQLAIVAVGCVVGFPLFTALALREITAAHSMVFIGALPLATACFAGLFGGERHRPAFWLFSVLGAMVIIGYALAQGLAASPKGDLLMLAAVLICGLGYAEGARLSRKLGGWQVISWSLALSLPVTLALSWATRPESLAGIELPAWVGLGYVSVFSMLVGFVFWYRGLAEGGAAVVSQLQLLQPFFGLMLTAMLLNEQVTLQMQLAAIVIIGCVAGARKFAR